MTLAFTEIIRYGADSPQIVRRLRASFDDIDGRSARPHPATITKMRQLLDATAGEIALKAFTPLTETPDQRGLG